MIYFMTHLFPAAQLNNSGMEDQKKKKKNLKYFFFDPVCTYL